MDRTDSGVCRAAREEARRAGVTPARSPWDCRERPEGPRTRYSPIVQEGEEKVTWQSLIEQFKDDPMYPAILVGVFLSSR